MPLMDINSLRDLEMITQDAYILGKVVDLRFDNLTWKIQGFCVKSGKGISKFIKTGLGRSIILVKPCSCTIREVVLLSDVLNNVKSFISADIDMFMTFKMINGMKVISKENIHIGTVETISLDLKKWSVVSLKIKLNRIAYEFLGIKKGFFGSKTASGILMTDIGKISDVIKLTLDIKAIKNQIIID